MPGVGSVCQTRSPKNGSSQSRGPGRAEIHGFLYEDGFLSAKFSVVGFGQWLVLASGWFWPVVGFGQWSVSVGADFRQRMPQEAFSSAGGGICQFTVFFDSCRHSV